MRAFWLPLRWRRSPRCSSLRIGTSDVRQLVKTRNSRALRAPRSPNPRCASLLYRRRDRCAALGQACTTAGAADHWRGSVLGGLLMPRHRRGLHGVRERAGSSRSQSFGHRIRPLNDFGGEACLELDGELVVRLAALPLRVSRRLAGGLPGHAALFSAGAGTPLVHLHRFGHGASIAGTPQNSTTRKAKPI